MASEQSGGQRFLEQVRAGELGALHVGIVDVEGTFRHKRVDGPKARKLLDNGYAFCNVLYHWDIGETPWGGGTFTDSPATLDPASLRAYPFESGAALCIADFADDYRKLSPRALVLDQLAKAEGMGLKAKGAFEFEFFLFDETPESLRLKDFSDLDTIAAGNRTYSVQTAALHAELFAELRDTMAAMEVHANSIHTELGPGCFEAPLKVADGIRIADDAMLFKNFAKAFFLRKGMMAGFMSKWRDDLPGQSGHLHVSLTDSDGRPVFHDPDAPEGLSETFRHFTGGVVKLMPELLAMCSHTINAYRRMVPGAWAPTYASWGVQNRTAAARAITGAPGETRLEFRVPSADTNPYLSLALCLGAGLWGIENRVEPPAAMQEDCYAREPAPGFAFPRTLLEAADRLERSQAAREIFGDAFVDYFVTSRRMEDLAARGHVTAWERRRYLEVV